MPVKSIINIRIGSLAFHDLRMKLEREKTLFSILNLSNKESISTISLTLLPYY